MHSEEGMQTHWPEESLSMFLEDLILPCFSHVTLVGTSEGVGLWGHVRCQ